MADRTVKVSLTASVSQYVSEFAKAKAATSDVADTAEAAQKKLEDQQGAMTKLGVGALAFGAIAAAGVGLAVSKYAEYQQAMSNVQAATHESTANMSLLSAAALKAGADTVFSATDAANAEAELAKAGISTADILNGALTGALSLASAGELNVADAAQIAATALTQFKLKGSDVPHVADLLAAGAGKAQGSVSDLSQALNQGGLVASQTGQSIEETTGTLAAFASAGLIGSDAGTSLKTMLLALESPSQQAQRVMDKYGISVYDSSGNMMDFTGIANVLQKQLGGLTAEQRNSALSTIFGNDAIRSASILYDNGASGIKDWTDKVNDSGYAAETAKLKLDNLNGDLEYLSGSLDTALIESGSAANDMLRTLIQTATNLVNAFASAPQWVQTSALALAALGAAVALAAGAFLLGVPAIANFAGALSTLAASEIPVVAAAASGVTSSITGMGAALRGVGSFLTGPFGVATAAAAAGVALLSKAVEDGKTSAAEYQNALTTAKDASDVLAAASKQWDGTTAVFGDLNDKLKDLPDLLDKAKAGQDNFLNNTALSTNDFNALQALRDMGKQLGTLASTNLPAAQKAYKSLVDSQKLTTDQQWTLLGLTGDYKDALTQQATKLGEASDETTLLKLAMEGGEEASDASAGAYKNVTDQVVDLQSKLDALIKSVDDANSTGSDAVSANIAYQQSIADVNEQIKNVATNTDKNTDGTAKYAAGVDIATQAGRDNVSMLTDLAEKGQAAADKQFALDGNTQAYRATLEATRQAVIDRAGDLGANADQAKNLADQIAQIPSETQWKMIADTADAQSRIDRINDAIAVAKANPVVSVTMTTDQITNKITNEYGTGAILQKKNGGIIPHLAGGSPSYFQNGVIRGAGGPRDDKVPLMASPGEFMVNAAATKRNLSLLNAINSGRDVFPASASSPSSSSNVTYVTNEQHFHMPEIGNYDSGTVAEIMGRAFARESAG